MKRKRLQFDANDALWGQFWNDCQVKVSREKGVKTMVDNVVNTAESSFDTDLLISAEDIEDFVDDEELDDAALLRAEIEEQSKNEALASDVQADIINGEDIPDEEEDLNWLWKDRIANNEVAVWTGGSGSRKTHFSCWLAAQFSRGNKLPDGEQAQLTTVLMIPREDKLSEMKKRCISNGADMTRVRFLPKVTVNDGSNIRVAGKQPFTLPRDLGALKSAIIALHAGLVIMDPVGAAFQAAASDQFVRDNIMHPLTDLAEELNVAICLINHPRRGNQQVSEQNFLSFFGNAKSIHEVARNSNIIMPENGNPDVSVWKCVKYSNGPTPKPMRYTLEDTPISKGKYVRFLDDSAVTVQGLTTNYAAIQKSITVLIYVRGDEYEGVTLQEIIQGLHKKYPAANVKVTLGRMVKDGRVERTERGVYNLPADLRRRIVA